MLAQALKAIPELRRGEYYRELSSTQDLALDWGEDGSPAPALILAETQSLGRGRRGRVWHSASGTGIYLSLLLRPRLPLSSAPLLSLAAGLGLKSALERLGLQNILVKWPNDVLIQGKKVAGILGEARGRKDLEFVVIGLGLNVSGELPVELRAKAASLSEFGLQADRGEILKILVPELLSALSSLESQAPEDFCRRWERESGMLGRRVEIVERPELSPAFVLGLDASGALRVRDVHGREFPLVAEELSLILS